MERERDIQPLSFFVTFIKLVVGKPIPGDKEKYSEQSFRPRSRLTGSLVKITTPNYVTNFAPLTFTVAPHHSLSLVVPPSELPSRLYLN